MAGWAGARRLRSGWGIRTRVVLVALLIVAVVAVGIVYSQRDAIRALLTGSHFVGGSPTMTSLHLPPGFSATVYASDLNGPRFFTFGPDGTVFSTERGTGSIVAFGPPDASGKASSRTVVITGLNDPTSVVYYSGALYVGEQDKVTRITLGPDLRAMGKQVIVPNVPAGGQHSTRTVLIGSDGMLYVSIGSTCNNCVETDPHRAAIWQYHLDGSGGRLYAHGLRNAVGLATNPWSSRIWITVNGRDGLGDNVPPDTIYALQDGGNYGWPECQAGTIIDPDLGHPGDCNSVVQPLVDVQAHSAPLGLAFYNSGAFPQRYHGLFVAFHGSWNRSVPTGYKVVFIPLDAGGNVAGPPQDFATGWLQNSDDASGRPVGVGVGPDGALYVSDDKDGTIYRITYGA